MSIHHRKSRSGGSYIISNMDSPGKSGDEKILKKNASSSFAAGGNKDGDNLVTLASAPSINLNNKEVEKGDRPSRRKKKRSISHRRAPVSPEGPFPKGAAEIHPSGKSPPLSIGTILLMCSVPLIYAAQFQFILGTL